MGERELVILMILAALVCAAFDLGYKWHERKRRRR